jgi:outer membrane protein
MFPRISVSETWQRGDQPVFVFGSLLAARQFAASNFAIDSLNHPDPIGFFKTTVGIEQLVFDGGRQRAAAASASLGEEIASASANETAAQIALATTGAFGRIVAADASRRAADGGLAAARQDLARAEHRRDVGMATDADVLSLVVHVAGLEQRAIQATSDGEVARAELNRLMGAPIEADVRLAPTLASPLDDGRADASALLAEADRARPELERAAASEHVAELTRTQARSALVPQVAAQAAFDVSGTRFNDRASSWILGGELRWTFSTGGAELAGLKASAAAVARAQAEVEDLRAAVHVEVVSALGRLRAARAREAAGRAAVDQARESQRIIRDRFEQGLAPVNDVLRASNTVLDADATYTSAMVDIFVADATLRRALGRTP